jgi:hypothetical protein
MAKLQETVLVIKISEIVRDDQTAQGIDDGVISDLEAVVTEIVGSNKLVEIYKG